MDQETCWAWRTVDKEFDLSLSNRVALTPWIDSMQVLLPILILSSTSLLGWILLYFIYYFDQTNKLNNPGNTNLEDFPPALRTMIDNFDHDIRLKIVQGSITVTRAVTFSFFPSYIVLSQRLFEKGESGFVEFNSEDLHAIVAHELGHIIPNSKLTLIMWMCFSAFLAVFVSMYYSLLLSLYMALSFLILFAWLSYSSRREEFQADAFAITNTAISVEQLVDCLEKLDLVFRRETPLRQRQSIFRRLFRPTLEQRIFQLNQINKISH
jgi:hypothetical protein